MDAASLPASMSTWLAVTTMCAICASLMAWAEAPAASEAERDGGDDGERFISGSSVVSERPIQ